MRPWFCLPIKENNETQRLLHETFIENEMKEASKMISDVKVPNKRCLKCHHKMEPFLMDGKAAEEACGAKGAYCLVCDSSLEEGYICKMKNEKLIRASDF